ncbi:hypothetical protein NE562_11680 [Butyricicoccus faecihominis]|uniref:hypothetical protein n=1 Tax=Butyricicoccus faecihominis TaxID=1712515 RepID=UPI002479E543|nr:hypothetical protein [Butyricicoccus faecihominis]MCQ5130323.1 hypothetical protein [Butyricicoccus faecihominis]
MAAKAKSQYADNDLMFRAEFRKAMVLADVQTLAELAKRSCMNLRTLHRRIKAPGTFEISELRRMQQVLKTDLSRYLM